MTLRILCISFSDINADSRVLRQVQTLAECGTVTTVSYGSAPPGATTHLEVDSALPSLPQTPAGVLGLALRRFATAGSKAPAVQRARELIGAAEYDLVVANEARALPLAHEVAGSAPVLGDMHEWAPEERSHVLSWKILVKPYMTWVCKTYLPRSAGVITVNESIARLYTERFGCRTEVVRNAGPLRPLEPSPMVEGRIRLVHSGAAVPGRNLEAMIEAVKALDERFSLDLYLVKARDGGKYWETLRAATGAQERITFHDAVAPDDLPATLNAYDVGVFSLPPRTTNHALMLPNKFFDFVQARLAIVFSPSPETSRLIQDHQLGAVTQGFTADDLTRTLSELTEQEVAQFKRNAHTAAPELSSATDESVIRAMVQRLTSPRT
ncbi:glycosyltransferase [Arthrobacter sp. 260]|uniref:glycosyltransferase n=1 Tax=Arthrobacter sp. 260 TaxID=2735314 RepID=UPI00149146FA|nr:glycosyltransferase [Arthrobacter sp. 260]NOJ58566.1 glycosyltransferase [Arthrobacter sp. 260]